MLALCAYLRDADDGIVDVEPMRRLVADWREYLDASEQAEVLEALRAHSNTGRPAGSREFVTTLEQISGRSLRKRRTGPRPKS